MVEFVGYCVLAVMAWLIIRRVFSTILNRTLSRAIDFAVRNYVPHSFAVSVVKKNQAIFEARKLLLAEKPRLAELSTYEQYGMAIIFLHEGAKSESDLEYYEGDDGSRGYNDSKILAMKLGVPGDQFEKIFINNIDTLKELAWQIDQPGQPHHNASFEVRLAVAVSIFYKNSRQNISS